MLQNNDAPIEFPNIVLGVTGGGKEGPQIIKPIVKTNGETHYDIIWMPASGDISYGPFPFGGYNDAKYTGPNVIIARTGKDPHICIIDVKTKKTIWHEDKILLNGVFGGIHSATDVDGAVVACFPYSGSSTQDNLVCIDYSNPQRIQKIDLPDCHAAIWVDNGPGKGFLWAVGRSTLPTGTLDSKDGKCLLRKYNKYSDNIGIKFVLIDTFTLVENPQELDKLKFPNWWESPHDIAIHDENTLWISTDSQVIAFDLKNNKVLPSPVSHDVFQSIKEIDTPSATSIKGLDIHNDCILYTQAINGNTDIKEFCIVKNGKKYTFKIQDDGGIYKARWAYGFIKDTVL